MIHRRKDRSIESKLRIKEEYSNVHPGNAEPQLGSETRQQLMGEWNEWECGTRWGWE
jgi:hypothetical protein